MNKYDQENLRIQQRAIYFLIFFIGFLVGCLFEKDHSEEERTKLYYSLSTACQSEVESNFQNMNDMNEALQYRQYRYE